MGNESSISASVLVDKFKEYAEAGIQGLLTVRYLVNGLAVNHHLEDVLDAVDLPRYQELTAKKMLFVGEVQLLVEEVGGQLELVRDRIGDDSILTLAECYAGAGFDAAETKDKVQDLYFKCIRLRSEFAEFKTYFDVKYKPGTAKAKRVVGAVTSCLLFLGCAALLAAHVIPGVAFVATPTLIGVLCVGGVASGIAAGALLLSKSEVERAMDFLDNIENRLRELKNHLSSMHRDVSRLSMADRAECGRYISNIIEHCNRIVLVSQSL